MKARCVGVACDGSNGYWHGALPGGWMGGISCVASPCAALPLHRRRVSLYARIRRCTYTGAHACTQCGMAGMPVQGLPVHPSVRLYASSTATVLVQLYCSCRRCYGAYATALLLRAIHLLCLSAVCMRVRLLILCCCMYVGAPAAAVVAMIWRLQCTATHPTVCIRTAAAAIPTARSAVRRPDSTEQRAVLC